MNRTQLIDMVKSHSWSDAYDSSELKEIISLYPWFQSVYTLLLDAQFSIDSLTFEESLKKNAVFVANREVLYYILRKSDGSLTIEEPSGLTETPDDMVDDQGVDDQGLRSREDLVAQIESRLAELEDSASSSSNLAAEPIELTPDENGILILDENEEIVAGIEEEGRILKSGDEDLLDLEYVLVEEQLSDSASAGELVDRFIDLNPRISQDREKIEEPIENIAEKVEDTNPALITETLAQIYINQKYYTRAILIYEKLSLKFPEKSSYFATQIEKIKELMS
jgi:hypothetical protein